MNLSYFVTGFLTLSGKTNGIETNAGHDNTEHALTTNLAYFWNIFFLSEEMRGKFIAIVRKQIIMKIIIWWQESHKTLTLIWKDFCGMVLGSPYSFFGETRGLMLDFKACHCSF